MWGHFDVCTLLVNHGANMSVSDLEGMTPIMWATKNEHVRLLKFLLKRGASADYTAKNIYNGTALSIAKIKGHRELINILQPLFPDETEKSPFKIMARIIVTKTCNFANVIVQKIWMHYTEITEKIVESETYQQYINPYLRLYNSLLTQATTESCKYITNTPIFSITVLKSACDHWFTCMATDTPLLDSLPKKALAVVVYGYDVVVGTVMSFVYNNDKELQ